MAYTGTGALKTDFTRTGKRSQMGLLEDGYKSVMRYLKNNFFDGARQVRSTRTPVSIRSRLLFLVQDAFDLMTGTWTPRRGWHPATLVADRRPLVVRAVSTKTISSTAHGNTDPSIAPDALHSVVLCVHDLCRPHAAAHLR